MSRYEPRQQGDSYAPTGSRSGPPAWRGPPESHARRRSRSRSPISHSKNFDRRDPEPYRRSDDVFQFRGNTHDDHTRNRRNYNNDHDSYRPRSPSRGDTYRPERNDFGARDSRDSRDFTFRHDAPANIDRGMRNQDGYRNEPVRRYNQRSNHGNQRGSDRRRGRGGYKAPVRAADRPFLQGNRQPTPELMLGMDEDINGGSKFRALNDISDSEEEDMDMSDEDRGSEDGEVEQPNKKIRTALNKAADGDSVPRWSNPDPYTALPPPDESQRKKKDVVKLIRKARVANSTDDTPKKAAETDDFISFDFGDELKDLDESSSEDEPSPGVPGAPSGPRYSHKQVLHKDLPTLVPKPANGQPVHALPPKPPAPERVEDISVAAPIAEPQLLAGPALEVPPIPTNRKRAHDEITKEAPLAPRKKFTSAPAKGSVVKEWKVLSEDDAIPWCVNDHAATENMGDWLHKEIVDFYDHVRPKAFEEEIRADMLASLQAHVRNWKSDANIYPFGSYVAGLYLPTADMDLVLVSNKFMSGSWPVYGAKSMLFHFRDFLERNRIAQAGTIEPISRAKVPLIKYVDRITGLRVDVSFENNTGLIANDTFQKWKVMYPAMPIIVTLVKQYLTMRGLNEPVNGGIGGFSVICLVVSLLQLMPQVQSRNMIPEHHLGEVLMEFFDLYGNEFDSMTTGIQLEPPGYLSKNKIRMMVGKINDREQRLSILDPNDSSNDIAGGSKNTKTILESFSQAFYELQRRMAHLSKLSIEERQGQSILGCILAGNYNSFKQQRDHLKDLYQHTRG